MDIKKTIHNRLKGFSFRYLLNCVAQGQLRPFDIDKEGIWFKTKYDFSVYSNLVDRILELDVNPDWETMESVFIENNIKQGDVFLDVGANIGYYSMLAAYLGASRIFAIEPSLKTYDFLNRNIKHNKLDNVVETIQIALGKENRFEKFLCSFGPKNRLRSDYYEKDSESTSIPVQVKTLDTFITNYEELNKIDFIKVDIEGFEYHFLLGAEKTIKRFKPMMLLEIQERRLVKYNIKPSDVFDFMFDLDYKYLAVGKENIYQGNDYSEHLKIARDFIFYTDDHNPIY